MSNMGDAAAAALRHPIAKGWLVHCVTASGAICGMLGIIAVSDKQPRDGAGRRRRTSSAGLEGL